MRIESIKMSHIKIFFLFELLNKLTTKNTKINKDYILVYKKILID